MKDILVIKEYCKTKNNTILDKLSPIGLSLLIKYVFIASLNNSKRKMINDIYNKYAIYYNINRFVDAQNNGDFGTKFDKVISELKLGKKRSHFIWYIFPQLANLIPNPSEINKIFSISGLNETYIYLMNKVLRNRLLKCHNLIFENITKGKTIKEIFGSDDKKYISHLTLFYFIIEDKELHSLLDMIKKYGNITLDSKTLKLLYKTDFN